MSATSVLSLWHQLALVMCGGALGAGARYLVGAWLLRQAANGFPWGTLAVNLAGSFAVGFLAVWLDGRTPSAPWMRAFLVVGFLGGLTTYSALMLESALYMRDQRTGALLLYLATTLSGGLVLVVAGIRVAQSLGRSL